MVWCFRDLILFCCCTAVLSGHLAREERSVNEETSGFFEDANITDIGSAFITTGCPEDSSATPFPNIGFAMYGYDVMKGYPNSQTGDPGYKHQIFDTVYDDTSYTSDCRFRVSKGMYVDQNVGCSLDFSSELARNSKEHSSALASSVEVSGGGFGVEFSASSAYKEEQDTMESEEKILIFSQAVCAYYFSRLDQVSPPPLNQAFIDKVKGYISRTDGDKYFDFINLYGTHVPVRLTFGARYIMRYEMTTTDYMQFEAQGVDVTASASKSGMYSVSGQTTLNTAEESQVQAFNEKVEFKVTTVGSVPPASGAASDWAAEIKDTATPIHMSLMSIASMFTSDYFSSSDIAANDLTAFKDGLTDALAQYCLHLRDDGQVSSCVPDDTLPESLPVYGGVNWNDCSTVSQYHWGRSLDCPMGYVAVGACSSGRNRDCSGKSHKLKCCRETYPATGVSEFRGCRTLESNHGKSIQCSSNENILSLCASGKNQDCGAGVANRITCCDTSIEISNNCWWKSGGWSAQLNCNSGEVMTGFCGSGRNKDCGGYSHKVRCCDILT